VDGWGLLVFLANKTSYRNSACRALFKTKSEAFEWLSGGCLFEGLYEILLDNEV